MKTITTNRVALTSAVAVVTTFTQKDGDYAGKLVLVGKDGTLEVKASNMIETIIYKDISFTSSDITEQAFLPFSIDAKKLLTVLKAAKTDDVQIELHPEQVVIKSGRSKVKVATLAQTQEIEIAFGNGNYFELGQHIDSMEQILHAVDTDNPKYELNGVLFQRKNGLFAMVGTDAKRLASIRKSSDDADFEAIVPRNGLSTIIKLFKGFDIKAEMDKTTLSVNTDSIEYSTKLINGKYPEWQRIIPQTFTQKISVPSSILKTLLEEASIFNHEIKIAIKSDQIKLQDFDGNTDVVEDIKTENTDIYFGVNSKSLIDFINSTDEESIQICFNGANLPIMLVATPEYSEVIMPVVMEDEINEVEEVQNAA